jgi:adenine-specific DNA methylase
MKYYKRIWTMIFVLMSTALASHGQLVIINQQNRDGDVIQLLTRMLAQTTARQVTELQIQRNLRDAEAQFAEYMTRSYSSSAYDSRNLADRAKLAAVLTAVVSMTKIAYDNAYPYMTRNKKHNMYIKATNLLEKYYLPTMLFSVDYNYVTNAHRQRIIAITRSLVKDMIAGMGPNIRNVIVVYAFKILSSTVASGDAQVSLNSLLQFVDDL